MNAGREARRFARLLRRPAIAGAPAVLLAALVASAGVMVAALLRGRQERRSLLESSWPVAKALAAEFGFPPPRPCTLPWREGLWQIDGVLEERALRLLVGPRGVEVSLPVSGAVGLDLARDEDFGRGGIENPSDDPYHRLPVEILGPGWWVRGVDGPQSVRGLPRPLLTGLRDGLAGLRVSLVQGRLIVFVAAADPLAAAASIRAIVQALRDA